MIFTGTFSMCVQYMHHSYTLRSVPPPAQHMEVIHSHVLNVLTTWWFNISARSREAVIGKLEICGRRCDKTGRDGDGERRENLNHIPDMKEGGPQGDAVVKT